MDETTIETKRRKRTDPTLPTRVHFKHGSFWYVYGGRWTALGKDRNEAIRNAAHMSAVAADRANEFLRLKSALEKIFLSRRAYARRNGLEFDLTIEWVLHRAGNVKWRCEVTGIPFSLRKEPGRRNAPFAPSIDRINSDFGYTQGNARIVCLAANFAMNEWGDDVMKALSEGWIRTEFLRRRDPLYKTG